MPYKNYNLRSPLYVKVNDNDPTYALGNVTLQIKVFRGSIVGAGSAPVLYTLTKNADGAGYVVFEIAELVRDYLISKYEGAYNPITDSELSPPWVYLIASATDVNTPTQAVTVTIQTGATAESSNTLYFFGFEGYNHFDDGFNYESNRNVLLSFADDNNKRVYVPEGETLRIPINVDDAGGGSFVKWYYYTSPSDITPTLGGQLNNPAPPDSRYAVSYIDVDTSYDRIYIEDSTPTQLDTIHIEEMDCTKFDPIKLTFYNKHGVLQDLFFTGKSTTTIRTKEEKFKTTAGLDFADFTYDTYQHQHQVFQKQAKERIVISSGNVNEDYNQPMKELMLSESVWMTKNGNVYPMRVSTGSMKENLSVNDKLFGYKIELEYAFDKVQNIR